MSKWAVCSVKRTRVRTIEPRNITSSTVPRRWLAPLLWPLVSESDRLRADGDLDRRAGQAVGDRLRHADLLAIDLEPTGASIEDAGQQHIQRANERGHKRRLREVVDLERRAKLLDMAGAHHHNPVG